MNKECGNCHEVKIPSGVVVRGQLTKTFIDELETLKGQDLRDRLQEYFPGARKEFSSDSDIRFFISQNVLESHVNDTMRGSKIDQAAIDIIARI